MLANSAKIECMISYKSSLRQTRREIDVNRSLQRSAQTCVCGKRGRRQRRAGGIASQAIRQTGRQCSIAAAASTLLIVRAAGFTPNVCGYRRQRCASVAVRAFNCSQVHCISSNAEYYIYIFFFFWLNDLMTNRK